MFVSAGDHNGIQPVHEAAMTDQLACMRFLLKKGGRTLALDGEGRTALHKVSACSEQHGIHR